MSYNTFPTTVTPSYGYKSGLDYKTLVFESESGNVEQARYQRRFPKTNFALVYQNRTPAEIDTIKKFAIGQKGMANPFWFIDWAAREWVDVYVGRGDVGGTATFDLHSVTTTPATLKIYVDGVLKTVTTDYIFVSGGGAAGADRITFQAGKIPTTGQLITSDFTGKLRIKGRFKDDSYQESHDSYHMLALSVAIYEVQW